METIPIPAGTERVVPTRGRHGHHRRPVPVSASAARQGARQGARHARGAATAVAAAPSGAAASGRRGGGAWQRRSPLCRGGMERQAWNALRFPLLIKISSLARRSAATAEPSRFPTRVLLLHLSPSGNVRRISLQNAVGSLAEAGRFCSCLQHPPHSATVSSSGGEQSGSAGPQAKEILQFSSLHFSPYLLPSRQAMHLSICCGYSVTHAQPPHQSI